MQQTDSGIIHRCMDALSIADSTSVFDIPRSHRYCACRDTRNAICMKSQVSSHGLTARSSNFSYAYRTFFGGGDG